MALGHVSWIKMCGTLKQRKKALRAHAVERDKMVTLSQRTINPAIQFLSICLRNDTVHGSFIHNSPKLGLINVPQLNNGEKQIWYIYKANNGILLTC